MTAHPGPDSTIEDVRDPAGHRRKIWIRRAIICLLTVVVLLGATGWLGVRSATVRDSGGGYTLAVEYPIVARAGLDVPWTVTITAPPEGFPPEITVAVTSDWFGLFETQGLRPEPADETTDGRYDLLTLTTPDDSRTMTLDYDTYVQPAAQWGEPAQVLLLVDGEQVAGVDYRTWVLP